VISGNRAEPAKGRFRDKSALARLEAALDLVDHIDPALAADQTVVAMTTTQRFQRVTDLHGTFLMLERPYFGAIIRVAREHSRKTPAFNKRFYPADGRTARDAGF
jgi:hypothetical protein